MNLQGQLKYLIMLIAVVFSMLPVVAQHYIDVDVTKRDLEKTFVTKKKEFKRPLLKQIITLAVITLVLGRTHADGENQWIQRVTPLFPMRPGFLPYSDPTGLISLTIHHQGSDELQK